MHLRTLFLCTHNACRSILSEAITNKLADEQIQAASAGSNPSGRVHPRTLHYLTQHNYPVSGLYSKSIDEMERFKPDIVVTVCDRAAKESCPIWLGPAMRVHWGLPDPSQVDGSEQESEQAFNAVIATIETRISRLLRELPLCAREAELKEVFDRIGGM